MSTLRVSNIEAKADASSPTIDEKVKVTSSQGRVLVQIDGKTAGITSIGINTTGTSFTIDGNQNVQFVGVITAANVNTTGVSTFTSLNVGTGGTIITTTASGLVGIGTTNPTQKLDVNGNINLVSFGNYIQKTFADNTEEYILRGPSLANYYPTISYRRSTGTSTRGFIFGSHDNNGNRNDWMSIWNGSVGIGTTNPTTDLTIFKTVAGGNGALLSIQNRSATSGTKCGIMFSVDNSDANWSDVGNAQIIMENTTGGSNTGQLKFRVYDGADSEAMKIAGDGSSNFRNGVAFARAGIAFDNSWDGYPGIVVFNSDGYGNTSNRTEFRIHGFSQSYSSYPGVSGADFGTNLRIDGATYFSSDSRHKTNIVDNPYGLGEILQLQPRKFNRINSQGTIEEDKGDILGFIAQEVREVIPEAVNYYPDEDTPNEIGWCRAYALSEGYILSTLVNAVKEQNTIIETLKSRIETLESQINT
jgi:hypothetical protein